MVQRKSKTRPKPKAQAKSTVQPKSEYDSPWKTILKTYFQEFINFFYPDIYADIDWTKPIEFLDKELIQVTRDAEIGRRLADALVKVYWLDGEESWLYIHIEVQSQRDDDLPHRVYVYNYRIYDQYKQPITSLVILGDNEINWRPDHFILQTRRTRTRFDFSTTKLIDYREQWAELEADHNLFSTVVMMHLRTLETTSNSQARKEYKFSLLKRLYEQGRDRQDIIDFYRLIDWMMTLGLELQSEFDQQVTQYEETMKMPYITSIEIRGEQRGELKGEQKVIIRLLNQRVGEIKPPLIEQIRKLSVEQLEELTDVLFTFSTVADLEKWLKARPKPLES
jgi:hypothetical protein